MRALRLGHARARPGAKAGALRLLVTLCFVAAAGAQAARAQGLAAGPVPASVAAQPGPVRDDSGADVLLPAPAKRIVSLAPHLTEQLFAVGAGAQVVGVTAYSDFPAAARQLPQVGDSAQLDLERIVALRPDLIVAWRSGNSAQQLERLAALRIPIYRSESRELADIAITLRRLGALTGRTDQAEHEARRFEGGVAALRERYASRTELRVFYQIWPQPLLTINRAHMISQALALCGARNVFADLNAFTPTVGEEGVLGADPDAIVTGRAPGQRGDDLERWRQRKGLRAAALGNLIEVNADTLHRQSQRLLEGASELCEKIDAARERLRAAGRTAAKVKRPG
jgi:iron complex transport system substrate-binding protein